MTFPPSLKQKYIPLNLLNRSIFLIVFFPGQKVDLEKSEHSHLYIIHWALSHGPTQGLLQAYKSL